MDDRRRPRCVPPKAHAPCPTRGHTATTAEGLGSGLACEAGEFVREIASSKIAPRGDEPRVDRSARIALCATGCVHVPVCTRNQRGFLPVPTSVVALYGTRDYLYAQPDAGHARTCLLAFMVACIARMFLYAVSSSFARHHFLRRIVRLLDGFDALPKEHLSQGRHRRPLVTARCLSKGMPNLRIDRSCRRQATSSVTSNGCIVRPRDLRATFEDLGRCFSHDVRQVIFFLGGKRLDVFHRAANRRAHAPLPRAPLMLAWSSRLVPSPAWLFPRTSILASWSLSVFSIFLFLSNVQKSWQRFQEILHLSLRRVRNTRETKCTAASNTSSRSLRTSDVRGRMPGTRRWTIAWMAACLTWRHVHAKGTQPRDYLREVRRAFVSRNVDEGGRKRG